MQCPKCGNDKTIVQDTRPRHNNREVWRRRMCINCAYKFTTFETSSTRLEQVSLSFITAQLTHIGELMLTLARELDLNKVP